MRSAMKGIIAVLLASAASAAGAQGQPPDPPGSIAWSVQPPSPTTRNFVFVRSILTGCDNGGRGADEVVFDPASGFVDVHLAFGSDVCEDYVTDDIEDIAVGYLPAGTYAVRFISCGMPFDPDAVCHETPIPRLSLVVVEDGRPGMVIPASSPASQLALAGVLAMVGLWLMRLRR
jgi:hypothetical protein